MSLQSGPLGAPQAAPHEGLESTGCHTQESVIVSHYDVVVIGSGPGGYVAAIHAAQQGLKTAIVERDEDKRLGGTCLLRGCIPTKAMLHSADLLYDAQRSEEFGVTLSDPAIDMDKMSGYRAKVVDKMAGGVQYLMKKNKIEVVFGHGRLTKKKGEVAVEGADGSTNTLKAKNVILATGSACRHLPFIKMDHTHVIDSDDLLQMTEKPEHLVVLGAGAVGSEFASVFLRYGSEVTLVEMLDRILPIEDTDVSKEVTKVFKKQGMKVLTSTKLTSAESTGDGVQIKLEDGKGTESSIKASHLLVAVGRRPVTEDAGLKEAGVKMDDGGFVEVDEFMRTSAEDVYAIGDIVRTPWLAHVASKEGILAVDHLCDKKPIPINYLHVPNCTYCSPEVSSVGLTEQAASEQGIKVNVGTFPFSAIGKATILGKNEGFVKIVAAAEYDELLGVHIVGPKATELITEATLALELEATVEELLHTIHPHPTLAEAVGEAAHGVTGHTIHM